jgi:sporulation protein YlmC with PRC-barrel domain
MTGTGEITGTEDVTETEGVTGTEGMTDTADVGGAAAMTDTDTVTDTDTMTGTGTTEAGTTGVMTGTEGLGDTEATTGTAGTTETADLQTPEQVETYGVVRASELMDFDVANTVGDDLGDVDDAVITLPDGCIQYVLLSSGGFLGLGEDQFLVPWRTVALNLQDGDLVLNVDESVFDNAPIFDADNMPDLNVPDWDADVNGFWESINITPPATAAPEGDIPAEVTEDITDTMDAGAVDTGAVITDPLTAPGNMDATAQELEQQEDVLVRANPCDMSMTGATGTMTDTAAVGATDVTTDTAEDETAIEVQTPQAVRLSALMDFGVKNPDGEDLGTLEDIVIDWQQSRLAYPILSFGGFLGLGDKWFVIPFDAVSLNPLDQTFIFDVEQEMLENAPGFDPDQLPDTTDPNWDTEIRSYWGLDSGQDGGSN